MIASLESVLQHALHNKTAVAGFVGLGWEDMRAYVKAAELENKPVIIQVDLVVGRIPLLRCWVL